MYGLRHRREPGESLGCHRRIVPQPIAIAIGFVGIVAYMTFRFAFSFALGGFVAIFHDVIICVGLIVLMGRELSLIHVGAVLTIAGYSISDTIAVFDRIREMLLVRTDDIEKVMNDDIRATVAKAEAMSAAPHGQRTFRLPRSCQGSVRAAPLRFFLLEHVPLGAS